MKSDDESNVLNELSHIFPHSLQLCFLGTLQCFCPRFALMTAALQLENRLANPDNQFMLSHQDLNIFQRSSCVFQWKQEILNFFSATNLLFCLATYFGVLNISSLFYMIAFKWPDQTSHRLT